MADAPSQPPSGSGVPPPALAPARPAALHRPVAAGVGDRAPDTAPAGTPGEGYAYPYPAPPFGGPPFGHGPWGEHGGAWHRRHHKHHMGHGHHGHPPPPNFDSSYPVYWDPPPGWHSHPVPPPGFHHVPRPRPPPFGLFSHPSWAPPAAGTDRTGESTDRTEASTAGEQSSVGAPFDAARQASHFRPLKPRRGQSSAPADSSSLARTPSLVAEIVSRVTQSLLAHAGANVDKDKAGEEAAGGAPVSAGPGATKSGPLDIPEELLQSIHQLQEGLRARGAASGPESEAARLLAQQKRRLRKGKLGKTPSLHDRSHSQTQLPASETDGPAISSDTVGQSAHNATPSVPPSSQARETASAGVSISVPSVPPAPVVSGAPPVVLLPHSGLAGAAMHPGPSERRLVPIAPAPWGAASQSTGPSEALGSALFVDLRPKKKRGPPSQSKDSGERKSLGRPRKPLLAMKCSKGEGLQGRKSGAIRKKLRIFGQKLQTLVAEQLYATTPDKIDRTQMEEAFTLMLTHKVCGVRSSAVMQLLEGSVFSKERIDIPVEEAPAKKKQKKGVKKKAVEASSSAGAATPEEGTARQGGNGLQANKEPQESQQISAC